MTGGLTAAGLVALVAGAVAWPLSGDWRWLVAGAVVWLGCTAAAQQRRTR